MIDIGGTIKKYRMKSNLKQTELARKIKVTSTYISAVGNNRKEPSISLLNMICRVVHLPKEVLFLESVTSEDFKKNDREIIDTAKEIIKAYYYSENK